MTSSLPSKLISDRLESAKAVELAAARHGSQAVAALAPQLAAELREGETLPDHDLLLRLFARRLARVREEMVESDEALKSERISDSELRRRRDEAVANLAETLRRARSLLDGIGGTGLGAEALALGRLSMRATVILRQAHQAIRQLRAFQVPELAVGDGALVSHFDPAEPLAGVEAATARLEAALRVLAQTRKDAQGTLAKRNAARATYDRTFSAVAKAFEASFTLAGMLDLADRIRPSRRHASRTVADASSPARFERSPDVLVGRSPDPRSPGVCPEDRAELAVAVFDQPGLRRQLELRQPEGIGEEGRVVFEDDSNSRKPAGRGARRRQPADDALFARCSA